MATSPIPPVPHLALLGSHNRGSVPTPVADKSGKGRGGPDSVGDRGQSPISAREDTTGSQDVTSSSPLQTPCRGRVRRGFSVTCRTSSAHTAGEEGLPSNPSLASSTTLTPCRTTALSDSLLASAIRSICSLSRQVTTAATVERSGSASERGRPGGLPLLMALCPPAVLPEREGHLRNAPARGSLSGGGPGRRLDPGLHHRPR